MYKIYYNKNPFFLLSPKKLSQIEHSETDLIINETELTSFINLFLELKSVDKITKIFILTLNSHNLFNRLLNETKLIKAGGGMVLNTHNQLLMMKRNNKWDMPKGKAEKGENIRQTAIREVEEECGITGLKIIKKLSLTYHIYFEKERWILKKSSWYQMFTDDTTTPVPQLNENITEVVWLSKEEVEQRLPDAYSNIKDIVVKYYFLKSEI